MRRAAKVDATAKALTQTARWPQARRSKYAAVRTEVDGITFHSKREAARYGELKLLLRSLSIRDLRLQPEFHLYARGNCERDEPIKIGTYRGDFAYEELADTLTNRWDLVVEDVKGMDTPLSRWKRKHLKAQYGIDVQIVK